MVTLTELEMYQGAFTFAFVLISVLLGLSFIVKYFRHGVKDFLFVGLTWMGIISPYFPDAINFIMILWTGNQLSTFTYFFLANAFVPATTITWMTVVTNLLYKEHKKEIMIFFTTISCIVEVIFLYFLFTDLSMIGKQIGPFYVDWALFIEVYLVFSIFVFAITGILFAKFYFKSLTKEANLKGKFLITAFISFTAGVSIDAFLIGNVIPASGLVLFIARAIVIFAAITFYIGFAMPNFVKNLFKTEEEA